MLLDSVLSRKTMDSTSKSRDLSEEIGGFTPQNMLGFNVDNIGIWMQWCKRNMSHQMTRKQPKGDVGNEEGV